MQDFTAKGGCLFRNSSIFTVTEMAADWRDLIVPQCIMWQSIALTQEQLDMQCSYRHTTTPVILTIIVW